MTIRLQWGLPEELHLSAATLIYDSFTQKFRYILGPRKKAIPFIVSQLQGEFGLAAIRNDELVGLAGAKTSTGELLNLRYGPWVRFYHVRVIRSIFVGTILWFERRSVGGLTLSNLSVKESAQGQGIGSRLIQEFIQFGREQGYRVIKLEVINSNIRAKSLYERFGFRITKHWKIPRPWSHLLGFTGAYEMSLTLSLTT